MADLSRELKKAPLTTGPRLSPSLARVGSQLFTVLLGAAPMILIIVWWDWAVRHGARQTNPFLVLPSQVLQTALDLLRSEVLLDSVLASVGRVLAGAAFGSLAAIPVGIAVGTVPWIRQLCKPSVDMLRNVPLPAWLPLFMLLFGIGNRPAVILIALACFFPVAVNTWDAVQYVNPIHLRVAQMLGASHLRQLVMVVLPSALPGIFTGLRVGMGIGVMVTMLAELMAVRSGVGYMISVAQQQYDMSTVILGIFVSAAMGYLLAWILDRIAYLVMPWRRP